MACRLMIAGEKRSTAKAGPRLIAFPRTAVRHRVAVAAVVVGNSSSPGLSWRLCRANRGGAASAWGFARHHRHRSDHRADLRHRADRLAGCVARGLGRGGRARPLAVRVQLRHPGAAATHGGANADAAAARMALRVRLLLGRVRRLRAGCTDRPAGLRPSRRGAGDLRHQRLLLQHDDPGHPDRAQGLWRCRRRCRSP